MRPPGRMASPTRTVSSRKFALFFAPTTWTLVLSLALAADGQVVSYGMRKLALSMNQFGLDMLRTMDRMDSVLNGTQPGSSFAFCPFCVGSSLAMILSGLQSPRGSPGPAPGQPGPGQQAPGQQSLGPQAPGSQGPAEPISFHTSTFDSLRHALYLGQMQPQEIDLAFYDLAAHLQLNLPEGFKAKRSTVDGDIEGISKELGEEMAKDDAEEANDDDYYEDDDPERAEDDPDPEEDQNDDPEEAEDQNDDPEDQNDDPEQAEALQKDEPVLERLNATSKVPDHRLRPKRSTVDGDIEGISKELEDELAADDKEEDDDDYYEDDPEDDQNVDPAKAEALLRDEPDFEGPEPDPDHRFRAKRATVGDEVDSDIDGISKELDDEMAKDEETQASDADYYEDRDDANDDPERAGDLQMDDPDFDELDEAERDPDHQWRAKRDTIEGEIAAIDESIEDADDDDDDDGLANDESDEDEKDKDDPEHENIQMDDPDLDEPERDPDHRFKRSARPPGGHPKGPDGPRGPNGPSSDEVNADEEEAASYRSSEASVSSEFAMLDPNDEYRSSPALFPLSDLLSGSSLMHFLTQIYIQRYLPLNYNYYLRMQTYYKTPIRSLDFAYAPEESRQHINAIVEQRSRGKIADLLEEAKRDRLEQTRFLLLSGLYFEGRLDFRDQIKRRRVEERVGKAGIFGFGGGARNRIFKNSKRPTQSFVMSPVNRTVITVTSSASSSKPQVPASSNSKFQQRPAPPPSTQAPPPPPPLPPTTKEPFNPFKPLGPNPPKTKESIRLRHSFSSYLNATILEMPFTGGVLSLVTFIPRSRRSMATILSRLNAQLFVDLVQNLEIRRIDVTMPPLNLSHSITNWNILFTQMGLASIIDSSTQDDTPPTESFAGISAFPLSSVTQLQHKTVLDISFEENPPEPLPEPNRKPRPKKSHLSAANRPRFVRLLNKRHSDQQIVQSPIMKILQNRPRPVQNPKTEPLQTGASKQIPLQQPEKRIHVNLEEEFLYFILDNVSGLVLAMGKYQAERS